MKVLVVGNVNGKLERLKGLVEVSSPDIFFVLGFGKVLSSVRLKVPWFYVRGREDSIELLAKSDGVDILSRVFMTKEGISFSGISGVYNPTTVKFTRSEWIKSRGKIDKAKRNCIFLDDVESFKHFFEKSRLPRLDLFFLADDPRKPILKELVELASPRYLFFPSDSYVKEKVGDTVFIGLEPVESPKGKYILNI